MGLQYLGNFYRQPNTSLSISYLRGIHSTGIDSTIVTPSSTIRKPQLTALSYYNKFQLDTLGKSLNLSFDYYNFNNNAQNSFSTDYYLPNGGELPEHYYSANNIGDQKSLNYSGTVDFDFPLKWMHLYFGGKLSHTRNDNSIFLYNATSGTPILDSSQSNEFTYTENTQALYLSGERKLSEKLEGKAGLRLENTQTEGNSITLNINNRTNYLKLFPSAYLLYHLNSQNTLGLTYNRRIERPAYTFLNPFRQYSSSISYIEGNPFLKPSFTNNLEFNYTYNGNLNFRLYYTKSKDEFDQVTLTEPNSNIQVITPINFINIENYGFETSYMFERVRWWSSYNSANVYSAKSTSSIPITNQLAKETTIYLSTNNDFYFNDKKTIIGSINFWYSSPSVAGLTRSSSTSELDVALKFLLLNKKLQLTFEGDDLYKGSISDDISYTNNIKQISRIDFGARLFKFNITYNFGNSKIKSNKSKFGNEEEQNRL